MARIELVVAVAENGVIGHKGDMPWRLPSDLKHFKQVTMGLPVIMGRRTWESIGRVLPGRKNIVISRSLTDLPDGAVQVATPDAALEAADNERVMIIGGGEIYRIFEPQAEIVH
ncbi:MAG: diacylglycerol kinase, partial [Alphaproteobacteria bacterium]|nr:diacylglycerol kinase [Alphaproteobacteria bacterium]